MSPCSQVIPSTEGPPLLGSALPVESVDLEAGDYLTAPAPPGGQSNNNNNQGRPAPTTRPKAPPVR